ncbi:unnamed protein product, partial [Ostreobium quekettii]
RSHEDWVPAAAKKFGFKTLHGGAPPLFPVVKREPFVKTDPGKEVVRAPFGAFNHVAGVSAVAASQGPKDGELALANGAGGLLGGAVKHEWPKVVPGGADANQSAGQPLGALPSAHHTENLPHHSSTVAVPKQEPELGPAAGAHLGGAIKAENVPPLAPKAEPGEPTGAPTTECLQGTLKPPKHPSTSPALVELGTLRLPFKISGELSIEHMARKVWYADGTKIQSYGDMLARHSGKLTVWHLLREKQLELLPLPSPPEFRIDVPADVAVKVTVVYADGRTPAVSYGVKVPLKSTAAEVAWALQQQHDTGLRADETLWLYSVSSGCLFSDSSMELHLEQTGASPGFIAFQVPVDEAKGYVLVRHENPNVRKEDGALECGDAFFGTPFLLPLEKSVLNGGKQACELIRRAARRALKPYASGHSLNDVKMIFKGCNSKSKLFPHYRDGHETLCKLAKVPEPIATNQGDTIGCEVNYATMIWDPRNVGMDFKLKLFNCPYQHHSLAAVDDTALRAAWRDTKKNDDLQHQLACLPMLALEELTRAGLCSVTVKDGERRNVPPLVYMYPTMEVQSAVHGTFNIKVYIWRHDRSRTLFAKGTGLGNGHFKLRNTLKAMLLSVPSAAAMYRSLFDWEENWHDWHRSVIHSDSPAPIPRLLEQVEAGPREEVAQPPGLALQMLPYQRQSLKFLIDCEQRRGGSRDWLWVRVQGTTWYSPVFNLLLHKSPHRSSGGFLAEEMGLGKTVEVLALVLSNPLASGLHLPLPTPPALFRSRGTVVICPVSLVGQWHDEIMEKLSGTLKVYMYHGDRTRQPERLAHYDIVITTYETLASDFTNNCRALLSVHWHRLILDEGHNVKDIHTGKAKACQALIATHRWVCTGTPINTHTNDLAGQFQALHMFPLDNSTCFNGNFKWADCLARQGTSDIAKLSYVLSKCMVRHTKKQMFGGRSILQLPEKKEEFVPVVLGPSEAKTYKKVHREAAEQFGLVKTHNLNVMSEYFRIMALLQPLRRMCSGGQLTSQELAIGGVFSWLTAHPQVLASTEPVAPDGTECPICLDEVQRPAKTPCQHWFCRDCIDNMLAAMELHASGSGPFVPKCPSCCQPFARGQLVDGKLHSDIVQEARLKQEAETPTDASGEVFAFTSKLDAVVSELKNMVKTCSSPKCLIFSQYTATLNALTGPLSAAGFAYRTITGSMPMKRRKEAIAAFQKDPPTTVFLLSMRSGGMGINLTAASHVFILEPPLNPALQEQAIGRAWRMGQQRQVTVKKFFVKGSIEENIIKVVKEKGMMGEQQENTKASKHAGKHVVAGSLKSDRADMRLAEFETLFAKPAF